MNTKRNDLQHLIEKIGKFNDVRGWNPPPSDIAKSIVIEAAELLEKFQWDESDKKLDNKKFKKNWDEVGQEVADVFWYIATFCKEANIDLSDVVKQKITWNEKKYPEKMFKGKHNEKYYQKQKRAYRKRK
jgi:NTP pyrophosphatase (non-canonical NTP hydrolase)